MCEVRAVIASVECPECRWGMMPTSGEWQCVNPDCPNLLKLFRAHVEMIEVIGATQMKIPGVSED